MIRRLRRLVGTETTDKNVVGQVDSGKSTLSGRLLHLLGRISEKQMHKCEKEAQLQVRSCQFLLIGLTLCF
ncbi:hypothetical protein Bca101_067860 [Brassica carinata]